MQKFVIAFVIMKPANVGDKSNTQAMPWRLSFPEWRF